MASFPGLSCGLELGLKLGNSVLEPGAISDEIVHDGGVLLGTGVGDKHGMNE